MSQLPDLRRDRKKSCDGNHNLVELGKAIAQIEKHTVASGRRRRMGQKAIRALIPGGSKKSDRGPQEAQQAQQAQQNAEHRGVSTNSNIEPGKSGRSTGSAQPYHSQEAEEQPTSRSRG